MRLPDSPWLTDENIHPEVVAHLRSLGLDVFDIKERGWRGRLDEYPRRSLSHGTYRAHARRGLRHTSFTSWPARGRHPSRAPRSLSAPDDDHRARPPFRPGTGSFTTLLDCRPGRPSSPSHLGAVMLQGGDASPAETPSRPSPSSAGSVCRPSAATTRSTIDPPRLARHDTRRACPPLAGAKFAKLGVRPSNRGHPNLGGEGAPPFPPAGASTEAIPSTGPGPPLAGVAHDGWTARAAPRTGAGAPPLPDYSDELLAERRAPAARRSLPEADKSEERRGKCPCRSTARTGRSNLRRSERSVHDECPNA